MNAQDLERWGVPAGDAMRAAFRTIKQLINEDVAPETVRSQLLAALHQPAAFAGHSHWGAFVNELLAAPKFTPRAQPAPFRQWGDDLDPASVAQMRQACMLPVSVAGALMPDAHLGYGLPIGGVLATENAVIPYAVGVDIACRMKLSVLDLSPTHLDKASKRDRLKRAIAEETRFGTGSHFKDKRDHGVMDQDWAITRVTRDVKDKAWAQLGTSGSGNHFVEFGLITVPEESPLKLPAGDYLALLSHSGSRGAGASVASHFSKRARELHPELPRELERLAWLDLDSEDGQAYWAAMNLMGDYAAANHACIHDAVAENLGGAVLLSIENHHNFAWKETHGERELIVHRKGATPAGKGVLGIIPGSMASASYVVRGLGESASLESASHGAGRVMSRNKAKEHLRWEDTHKLLKAKGVELLSAGIDEAPAVYKDIDQVMAAQADLVERLAVFQPRIVKMAPPGERPED